MTLSGFDRFVWAACFYSEILLLVVLWMRHRARSFPIFTAYVAQCIAVTIADYLVFSHLSQHIYFRTYWSLAIVDEVFQILVFCEIAFHVFCPTGVWAADVRKTFFGLISVSTLVAILLTWLARPIAPTRIQTFVMRSNFFSAALMSELFVGMMVLSFTAGLPWKTHVARIAQGLGAFSLVCVAKDIISNAIGVTGYTGTYTQLVRVQTLAYLACESYWILMLWQEAPAPRELPESMRTQIFTLQKQVESDLIRIRAWRRN